MKPCKLSTRLGRFLSVFLAIIVATSPLLAQQRHNAPKKPATEPAAPAPTFDTLLAADSFKIYCEVRSVGTLVHSPAVTDLLDPIMKLGGPPKEFKELVTWLNAHSDTLAGSRMMVAGWPSRPNLPNVVVAIEFSTPEEAKKFFPELRDFMPTLLPTPTPSPSPTPNPSHSPGAALGAATVTTRVANVAPSQRIAAAAEPDTAPPAPPYKLKQVGSLILISDGAINLQNLNPKGSKPLEEDQNFLMARNRFASESIFLYIDLNSIEKEEQERRKRYEEEDQKRIEEEARNPPKQEEPQIIDEPEVPSPEEQSSPTLAEVTVDTEQPAELTVSEPQAPNDSKVAATPQPDEELTPLFYALYSGLFGGQTKWPEAIGAALVFEGDAYVVRTLIINAPENKGAAIPFVPQFVSGPAITPESPNIFPADTDLFISASADYPQIYEGLLKAMAQGREQMIKNSGAPGPVGPPADGPLAAYEKKLGIKIKDDLLPLLGNEVAFALPRKATAAVNEATPNPQPADPKSGAPTQQIPVQGPNPVIAISIKDREGVQKLIPKIIESFGFKGAGMLAQTEKRDGTELVSYAGVFSYAFIGDFLVISPDPAETRRVVDAYLNHQTLASDSHFRNSLRWQPRQVQGQVYVSPGFVEQYLTGGGGYGANINEKTSEFLARVNPTIDPVTYSLTNDGLGPLHEMHVPKNLLMLQVVAISAQASESLPRSNESVAKSVLRTVGSAEASYRATENSYGTLDELVAAGLLSKEMTEKYGYKIEVAASKDKFEITAVPIEYGQTGKLSYFLDESQILRAGDHGGGTATVADQPLE